MRSRSLSFSLAIAGLSLVLLMPARAANVTFTAAGSFIDGSSLSGTVTIDTATGLLGGADLAVTGIAAHFTQICFQGTWPPAGPFLAEFEFENGQATNNLLTFLFPPASVAGYGGGLLCGTSNDPSCFDGTLHYVSSFATKLPDNTIPADSFVQLSSGSLTAPTPEPSAAALWAAGLALLAVRRPLNARRRSART